MKQESSWNGDNVRRQTIEAAKLGVNRVMADCVIEAKLNHPGWNNITGTAEGSIRIVQFAEEKAGTVAGLWGSADVNYVIWLELKHGSFLRSAADRIYPRLAAYIREALGN